MSDYYKIACPEVNLILLIKKLSLAEVQQQYVVIKRKISTLKKPVTINSYMKYVLNSFLHNSEEFFNNLPDEEDERLMIIKAVYEAIIEAYPPFDITFVCADINNSTFLEGIKDDLGEVFAESLERIATQVGEPLSTQLNKPNSSSKPITSLADVSGLDKYLKKHLIGQDQAVDAVVKSVKLIASGLYRTASFFFIGPTGVGKTELGKLLGKKYSGNFWKINCAEYANKHEYAKLIGSPPGYVGHTDSSLMAEKAEKSNKWVILFDEVEKAHPKFYDFLLSLLDDGTCTDNMGRVLDFSESVFIFTSNAGVSDIKVGKKLGFGGEKVTVAGSQHEIKETVKKEFSPEFLNRIDNYIFFNSLTPADVRKIAKLALNGIPIKKHKVLLDYIVKNGYSEEYGARNVNRFIKNSIAPELAQLLLERRLPNKEGDLYTPKIIDNKLYISNLQEINDQTAG
jgi:ATP-dependent Clp protease ATP-binding subunit ClpA